MTPLTLTLIVALLYFSETAHAHRTVWTFVPESANPTTAVQMKELDSFHGIKPGIAIDRVWELMNKQYYKRNGKGFYVFAGMPIHPEKSLLVNGRWLVNWLEDDKDGNRVHTEGCHFVFAETKLVQILTDTK